MTKHNDIINHLKGKSQADKVLWYLEIHGRITNLQCHEILGIRHTPSVIRELRKRFLKQNSPYKIINERKKGCNRFGEPIWWDDYVLINTKNNKED